MILFYKELKHTVNKNSDNNKRCPVTKKLGHSSKQDKKF